MPTSASLSAVLTLAAEGWPVFLLGRTKRPVANCPACPKGAHRHDPCSHTTTARPRWSARQLARDPNAHFRIAFRRAHPRRGRMARVPAWPNETARSELPRVPKGRAPPRPLLTHHHRSPTVVSPSTGERSQCPLPHRFPPCSPSPRKDGPCSCLAERNGP